MKKIFIILIILILAIAGYFIWTKWIHPSKSNDMTVVKAAETGIDYYHCGMHPWITSDKPGKCPICGMDLTPVYKSDALIGKGIVSIDPAMIQNIGVKTEMVEKRNLTHTIRTTGRIDYDETKQSFITTKFSGYIEKLYVDYTGKQVHKGQPLFEIYSPELVAAQQEYLQAIRYRSSMEAANDSSVSKGAEDLLQSAKRKLQLWDISSEQLSELEQSRNVKKSLTVYSQYSGVVTEKNVFEGMEVQAGMNLFKISDVSEMWVYADVYENELSFLKTGDDASIELPYNTGQVLQGKVVYIYPYLQEQTRTARVRIQVLDTSSFLKKDMYVTVNIQPKVSINTIAIPAQSVIHSGTRDIIVLSLGDGKFKSTEVKLGALSDNYYEVKEGLSEGDMIVTSSQFLIDSESNLKAGMSSMQSMPGMNHGNNKVGGSKDEQNMEGMNMSADTTK